MPLRDPLGVWQGFPDQARWSLVEVYQGPRVEAVVDFAGINEIVSLAMSEEFDPSRCSLEQSR